jgi:hypothetical protein
MPTSDEGGNDELSRLSHSLRECDRLCQGALGAPWLLWRLSIVDSRLLFHLGDSSTWLPRWHHIGQLDRLRLRPLFASQG